MRGADQAADKEGQWIRIVVEGCGFRIADEGHTREACMRGVNKRRDERCE